MQTNDSFINKILKKYLFPTILTILGTTITSFINSLIVGNRIGSEALSAMNIVSSFTFLFAMLGCLISIGASSAASVAIGKEDHEAVGKYISYAFLASVIVPVLLSVPILVTFKDFMMLLGADENLYLVSLDYARIVIAAGFLTTLMYYPFNFLRLDGRATYALLVFGLMTVTDVILLFVFTGLGLGLKGVGLAVVISTLIADMAGILCLFSNKTGIIKWTWFKLSEIGRLTSDVWTRGAAAGLNNLCNMLRTLILNAWILKSFGTGKAAEFAVACAVINMTAASVSGCGQTIVPLTGIFYGEKDSSSLKIVMRSGVKYAVIIHTLLCICAIPLTGYLVRAFGISEGAAAKEAATALIWVFVSLIPASVLNVFIYYYSTLRKALLSCVLTAMRALAFVLLFAYIFIRFGLSGYFYASFLLAELASLLMMFLMGYINRIRHPEKSGILYMEKMPDDRYISFSVKSTTEGAVEASSRIADFCIDHNLDKKYKSFLSMSIEEMLIIINEHCLKENPEEYIDVRIYFDDDGLIMRIRCGGLRFDPVSWYKKKCREMTAEEIMMDESLGMKMIVKNAKSVVYQNTFGTNNLIIAL